MALVSSAVAYFVLLPFEFREFGKALISSTVYLSNVLFFRQSGYFDSSADEKALLHTWSLSVEEQFYIFLPFLILIFAQNRRALKSVLAILFATSLLACILFTRSSHMATFFLFPFRAWELLAGVLLAVHGQQKRESWQHGALPSWLGIALLAGSIGFVQAGDRFPGWQVLMPVAGATLMIWNGRDENVVNRMLSSPVPVFVGLISYSLYIWHWPVLTLSQYYRGGYDGKIEAAGWLLFAFLIAVSSWWFVERPIRRARWLAASVLLGGSAIASVVLLLIGGTLYLKNGLPNRFGPEVRTHIEASADFLQDWSRCYVPETGPLQGQEVCPIGPVGPPKVLIWGDSHLRAFREGLALAAREHDRPGLIIWNAGCPPLFGLGKEESAATRQEDAQCQVATERMQNALSQLDGIDTLLLIGRWSYYAQGRGIGIDAHNQIALWPLGGSNHALDNQPAVFGNAVAQTLDSLSGSFDKIFVLRQVPEIPQYDSRNVARLMAHGRLKTGPELEELASVSIDQLSDRTSASENSFYAAQAAGGISILDSWQHFCSTDSCSAIAGGQALYFDNNHITNSTSLMIRDLFDPVFSGAAE